MKYTEFFSPEELNETKSDEPEDLLRGEGMKIKLTTPTAFGLQIDFAKKYPDEDVMRVLENFNIKIKNKSVFIIY